MALEQHPVPQQISSYQFRLVGDMTLKQFFQLAAGAGLGLLVYGSPLPAILKWPLIIFFVMMGAAFAFLPIQERPLSVWLVAFFRAIYQPTIYTWKREPQPEYFAAEDSEAKSISEMGEQGQTQGDIQAQFGEVASGFLQNLEGAEEKYLSKITGLFKHEPSQPQQEEIPKIVNDVTAMPAVSHVARPQETPTMLNAASSDQPALELQMPQTPVAVQSSPTPQPSAPVSNDQYGYFRPVPKAPAEFQAQTNMPVQMEVQPVAPETIVPEERPYQPQFNEMNQTPNNVFEQISKGVSSMPVYQSVTQAPTNMATTPQPVVSNDLSGLETPSQANILVGKVLDGDKNPVANAIMEIKDEFGRPVRALKTDKDGKFRIVTPLHDGRYTIYTEKDALDFEPIDLELQETIVEPLLVEPRKH